MPSSSGSMLPPESTATTGVRRSRAAESSSAATAAAPAGSTTILARSTRASSGPRERLLGDGADLVDVVAHRGEGDVARQADRDAVGHRLHRRQLDRRPVRQRGRVRRGAGRLHADDPYVGAERLDRDRDPAQQPAAAGRARARSARRAPARAPRDRACPAPPRCRRGRTGGSAPPRSPRRTGGPPTSDSSSTLPSKTTSAPYARVARSLGIGAPSGMNTVDLMPSSCAASATPWAWLPAEAATTPRARSSGVSREIRT